MNLSDLSNQITVLVFNNIRDQVSDMLEKEFKAQKVTIDVKTIMAKVGLQSNVVEKVVEKPVVKKGTKTIENPCKAIMTAKSSRPGEECGENAKYPDKDGNENCRCAKHKNKDGSEKKTTGVTRKPAEKKKKGTISLPNDGKPESTVDNVIASTEIDDLVKQLTINNTKEENVGTPTFD